MRISDWSSDVCSSDLLNGQGSGWNRNCAAQPFQRQLAIELIGIGAGADQEKIGLRSVACVLCGASGPIITLGYRLRRTRCLGIALEHCHRIFRPFQFIIGGGASQPDKRSEEHTSELQSLM